MSAIVECHNLTKKYRTKTVLNNFTATIEENTITGLIGRNGAGKTTLLKILTGYLKETSGKVAVFSERPFNSLKVSANSIFVDDQMSYPPALQLYELIEAAARFYPNFNLKLAKGLFDYFSFDPKGYHKRLSKGQKSTFNAIIGIAARCPLTIFDEPTTGMDEGVRKDFYRALLKDYLEFPRTIIISSHHLNEIEDLIEDVLLLKNGRAFLHLPITELKEYAIAFKGRKDEVLRRIGDRDVLHKQYIGADTIYAVVKNDFQEEDLEQARRSGLEISSVRSSDLFVYLTKPAKGGIDDVFGGN